MSERNHDTAQQPPSSEWERLEELFAELDEIIARKCDVYEWASSDVDYESTASRTKTNFETRMRLQREMQGVAETIEHKRASIITHISGMDITYDEALQLLARLGVGTHMPTEEQWLESLGLREGAVVQFGVRACNRRTVTQAGMLLNKRVASADVKPYAWFRTGETDGVHIVGADFATKSLQTSIAVIRRYDEVG